MKIDEIRALETVDLLNRINDAKQELMNLRFRMVTGNLTDVAQIRQTKRRIARLMTVLNERKKEGKS
jgi:large subunit ribosomal protein L29